MRRMPSLWFTRPQCLARARHRLEKVVCSRLWWLFRAFPKFELEWKLIELWPVNLGTLSFRGIPSSRAVVPFDRALNPVVFFERIESVSLARVEENVSIDALKLFLIKKSIISRFRSCSANSLLFWWSQSFLWRVWSNRAAAQLAAHWQRSVLLPFFAA